MKTENIFEPDITQAIKEGNALLEIGRYKEVAEVLEPFFCIDPDNINLLLVLGQAYSIMGEYTKARTFLSRVCYLSKDENIVSEAYLNIVHGLIYEKEFKPALKIIKQLLEKAPDDRRYHSEAACCYREMGNKEKAFYHLKISLSMPKQFSRNTCNDNTEHTIWNNAAYFYKFEDNFLESLKYAKKILKISPIDIVAIQMIGDSYFELEKYKEAKEYYEKLKLFTHYMEDVEYADEQIELCDECMGRC